MMKSDRRLLKTTRLHLDMLGAMIGVELILTRRERTDLYYVTAGSQTSNYKGWTDMDFYLNPEPMQEDGSRLSLINNFALFALAAIALYKNTPAYEADAIAHIANEI